MAGVGAHGRGRDGDERSRGRLLAVGRREAPWGGCMGGEHGPMLLVSFLCVCTCSFVVLVRKKGKRRERKEKKKGMEKSKRREKMWKVF
jgi:hypothetical protein